MKKNYLKNLTLLFAVFTHQFAISQSWTAQSSGSVDHLYAVAMPSSSVGSVAGSNGAVKGTSNGGTSWVAINASANMSNHNAICFLSTSLGWMVDAGGYIWKTTAGPGGWSLMSSPTSSSLYALDFASSTVGWAGGAGGELLRTINGTTWSPQSSGILVDIRSLDAVDVNTAWFVGAGGIIRKTVDGGTTWIAQTSGTTTVTFVDVFFLDANVGWVVGTNGTIKKTTDGGATWNDQTSGSTVTLRSVHFVSANEGWTVGDNGTILRTTNGGTTWSPQVSGTTQTLHCVYMTSASEGWAVGNSGVIRKYCTFPGSPASITGASAVCSGSSQTYSVPNEAGASYNWTFPSGWVQTAGGTTNSITVTVGSISGNVSVTPFNACGTASSVTLATTVTATPVQPSSITGSTQPCLGTSQVYSVSGVAGVNYNWTLPVGWTQTAGGTSNSITVTVGSGSGDILVNGSNTCGNSPDRTLNVSVLDVPAQPTITGNQTPCAGTNVTYTAPSIIGSYSWSFPAGWSQISGGSSQSVMVLAGGVGSGDIILTPSNACGNGPSQTLPVIVYDIPQQPSGISGSMDACEGAVEMYSVNNEPGIDYAWTFPGDWMQTGGGTTNTVSVQVGTQNGTITVVPSNLCGTGPSQNISVLSTTIDESVTLAGATLTANEAGASYQWLDCTNGNAPISGATAQSYSPTLSGSYAVEIAQNGCVDTSECVNVSFAGLDEKGATSFEVFPNPSNGSITVSAQQAIERIEVVSIYGQVVYAEQTKGQTQVSFNIEEAAGIYYVKAHFKDSKIVGITRITKQ